MIIKSCVLLILNKKLRSLLNAQKGKISLKISPKVMKKNVIFFNIVNLVCANLVRNVKANFRWNMNLDSFDWINFELKNYVENSFENYFSLNHFGSIYFLLGPTTMKTPLYNRSSGYQLLNVIIFPSSHLLKATIQKIISYYNFLTVILYPSGN